MANRYLYLARHGEAIDEGELSPIGREQAELLGRRLAEHPITAVHHSPLPRAAATAEIVAAHLPGAAVRSGEVYGDYVPAAPPREELPPRHAAFLDGFTETELASGPPLAAEAIARHAGPAAAETHELIVTPNYLIAWFVRHALGAPDARWMGLNQGNCALTAILYRPEAPPSLLFFNDMSHLPPDLRWTGFPAALRA
ncbi:histidine phosphatase family protein [Nonomuraea fastidiosa]|uniref:histidine phosphatase family protein n=1 Tax=Nonomuraea fastidiosa TaxID=46173 RepID=UPI0036704505